MLVARNTCIFQTNHFFLFTEEIENSVFRIMLSFNLLRWAFSPHLDRPKQ